MSAGKNTALIILAAGNSSRLGQPKQQLQFEGKSLLERAVQSGLNSPCQSVLVVLGAYHDEILQQSDLKSVRLLIHQDWQNGMGSSIKAGLKELLKEENPDQIIIMLCDQPFVDGKLLTQLISKQQETGSGIIACSYVDTVGAPVLFDRRYFPLLQEMEDSEGAKRIIEKSPEARSLVPFEQGKVDIDTPDDYRRLMGK